MTSFLKWLFGAKDPEVPDGGLFVAPPPPAPTPTPAPAAAAAAASGSASKKRKTDGGDGGDGDGDEGGSTERWSPDKPVGPEEEKLAKLIDRLFNLKEVNAELDSVYYNARSMAGPKLNTLKENLCKLLAAYLVGKYPFMPYDKPHVTAEAKAAVLMKVVERTTKSTIRSLTFPNGDFRGPQDQLIPNPHKDGWTALHNANAL